jgi:hypothetical protein
MPAMQRNPKAQKIVDAILGNKPKKDKKKPPKDKKPDYKKSPYNF